MLRQCLDCGSKLLGRSDKKFCSDQCRNNFNNRHNTNLEVIRRVNAILKKNRRVLEVLNKSGKTKVHKDKMLSKGFNFSYFTNTYKTQAGAVYYFCYEQGFLPIENDFFMLVVRNEE